ncbi:hypothetical protein SDC9_186770 [bioreactor metagenome]|uniref:Uncharacterized protein n=1 Tax=bioreactor metagenome TaxID=1076179 RepID=A0A645HLE0_9ZZZZ
MADGQPDSRNHRAPGAGLHHAVRGQGQPAGDGGFFHAHGHGADADFDHRPHPQHHLARAPAAAAGPARAHLLGSHHAGAAAAGAEPGADVLRHVGLARHGGAVARQRAAGVRFD